MGGRAALFAVVAALLAAITGSTSAVQTFTPSSEVARLTVYSEVDVRANNEKINFSCADCWEISASNLLLANYVFFHVQGDITWRSNSASNLTIVVDTHSTGPILSFIEEAGSAELKIQSSIPESSNGFVPNGWSTGLTLGLALLGTVFVTRFSPQVLCLLLLSVLVTLHYANADIYSVERVDVTILVPRSVRVFIIELN